MDARERAVRYLNLRMATCHQMRDYLKRKGHEDKEIDPLIEELKEYGYLDDLKYSRLFIESGFEKGRGIYRIRRELRQKGVDEETITAAEDELESLPDEYEMAMEIAARALENVETSEMDRMELEALKGKVARRLAGRGFSPSVIYSVIGKLL